MVIEGVGMMFIRSCNLVPLEQRSKLMSAITTSKSRISCIVESEQFKELPARYLWVCVGVCVRL